MLTPLDAKNWNYEAAAHLLNRAGFGGAPEEILHLHEQGLEAAVENLLRPPNESPDGAGMSWDAPVDVIARRRELRDLKSNPAELKEKLKAMRQEQHGELADLRSWWLARMKATPAPLTEKMTLFWHGHFATSAQKVKLTHFMWQQNELFRRFALGNFGELLHAVSRDPAMMIYLDLQQSRKAHPNENWAREVMELFTLGIGHYTENDVRESARAFTGYRIDYVRNEFRFVRLEQDEGTKTFLGRTGNFSGDDILNIIVEQPACAEFIGRKLWRFFVEDDPSPPSVAAVADLLRRHQFEMRPALREILLSADFYSPRVRRAQIKSPVEFLVQSCKLLQAELPSAIASEGALAALGQILFAPPNVKGWDGGKSWVSTATLLFRYNFANYLLNGTAQQPLAPPALQRPATNVADLVSPNERQQPELLVASLAKRLYQTQPSPKERDTFLAFVRDHGPEVSDETLRHLIHLMMSTPEFQLT